jgi:hypothetical protein
MHRRSVAIAVVFFGLGLGGGVAIAPRLRSSATAEPAVSDEPDRVPAQVARRPEGRQQGAVRLAVAAARLAQAVPKLQPAPPRADVSPDNHQISLEDAPQPVRDVVTKLAMANPLRKPRLERRMYEGNPYYKAEFQVDGMKHEMFFDPKGAMVESQLDMPPSQMPALIHQAITQAAPGAQLIEAKRMEGLRYPSPLYEVDVTVGGTRRELQVNQAGQVVRDRAKD